MPYGFRSLAVTDLTQLRFLPMGQADASAVAAWRYPGEYAFYDFVADPEDHADLLDPPHRRDTYFSARLPAYGLIGFAEIKPEHAGKVEVGLGLRPECAGRGLGLAFVQRLCSWVTDRSTPTPLVLRVATFNTRAIRVYERAGFRRISSEISDVNGAEIEFVRMERTARIA
jgi:[ribosomal protein S18]-alanine N-acetyltransferase